MTLKTVPNEEQSLYPIHSRYLSTYVQRSQTQFHWAVGFLQRLDLKGLARIVDWGCRDGRVSMEIARRYPGSHVIGIDSAIQLLEEANEHLARHVIPNLEFRFSDLTAIDLHNGVDAIFSSGCLNWVYDQPRLLEAMRRSLKPRGRIALSFFAEHGFERFDVCLREVVEYEKWKPYFTDFHSAYQELQPHAFAMMLKEAGFWLQRMEFVPVHDVYTTPIDFAEWLTSWIPHLRALPEELHEVFLADVTQRHIARHPLDERGHLHRNDYLLEIEAWKGT